MTRRQTILLTVGSLLILGLALLVYLDSSRPLAHPDTTLAHAQQLYAGQPSVRGIDLNGRTLIVRTELPIGAPIEQTSPICRIGREYMATEPVGVDSVAVTSLDGISRLTFVFSQDCASYFDTSKKGDEHVVMLGAVLVLLAGYSAWHWRRTLARGLATAA
jgi:hypothetical protein